ncbi:LPXTG cell wall anchor domain-containing protein [Leucobacter sp. NPDC077196]|uniref:DUF7507 domain-containing protein n=1 Tax=Leucobacter sp. NPDC077196 TaxID=3154959 RepID=UPI003420A5D7
MLLLFGFAEALTPTAAHADPVVAQPGELVVNGGAEQGQTFGWTGVLGRYSHGVGGYPQSVIVDENGLTGETYDGGQYLFTGLGAASTAAQSIDLSPSAAAIDNGNVDALISAKVGGYTNQADNARVTYSFRDANDVEILSTVFGPVLPANRGNVSGFVPFDERVRLPGGTRSVLITIDTQRFIAPANDGYVDNVSLVLDAPSPVAAPDSATTDQGVPVVLNPAGNDTPGAGATIVPSSVRLLDGDAEVTSLTTADGEYTVDTVTGLVTFTPNEDFTGTTVAVPYRISDSSGQQSDSTLTVEVPFIAAPALEMVKSADPSSAEDYVLGANITYSFLVTNTGNIRIDDLSISENVFTGAGEAPVATCPRTSLEPGESVTCTASYTLVQADIDDEGVSNSATAVGIPEGSETPVLSDPSTFQIPVDAAPAISLVKSATPAAANGAGDAISYTYLVTNTGNVTVDEIEIEETEFTGTGELPAATCPVDSLLPGASTTCTTAYELTQADVDSGEVTNTALALGSHGDAPVSTESSTATVSIAAAPGLTLSKTSTSTEIISAGETLEYSFLVTNTGNVTLDGITVDDSNFSGTGELSAIACPATSLAPGGTITCTASYTVMQADVDAGGSLSNTATVSGTSPGGDPVDSDPSNSTIDVVRTPGLSIVKTANVEAAAVGQTITYSFLISNTGNVTVTNPRVIESEFSGTGELSEIEYPADDVLLQPGADVTYTATYTLTQSDIDAGELSNSATATGAVPPGTELPETPASTVTVETDPTPALALEKTADVTTITAAGQEVTYSFHVRNIGNVTLTDIAVAEGEFSGRGALSEVVCPADLMSLVPGEGTTCTATYTVIAADLTAGLLSNTAIAVGTAPDGETAMSDESVAETAIDVPAAPQDPGAPQDPPAPQEPGTPGAPSGPQQPGDLPTTGADLVAPGLVGGAAVLLAAGAISLALRRRKNADLV